MYLEFYKLHLKPFQISTDPRFLWLGEKHQEALAVLKYGIMDNKGFLLLTGDVGTGKTTLLNALVDSLGDDVLVAMVADPGLAKMDFFNFVADSFGMNKSFRSKGEFLIYLKNYLIALDQQGKQALLIIDECQHLNQKLLEEVRLLSNIEKTSTKLINIFFVGQSEFNNIILRPQNRAIRQRITINYDISPLSEDETAAYVRFRLGVAGAKDAIFTIDGIKEVYRFSNGYPRLINIICDQALLTGFVKEKHQIDENIVAECAKELKIDRGRSIVESDATPEARSEQEDEPSATTLPPASWLPNLKIRTPLIIALIVVLIIWVGLVAAYIFNQQRTDNTNNALEKQSVSKVSPGAVTNNQTSQPTPDRLTSAGSTIHDQGPSRAGEEKAADPVTPAASVPVTSEEDQVEGDGTANLKQAKASPSSSTRKPVDVRISLADIHEKYGVYPEVHFDVNSNNLDDRAYEVLNQVAQFCLQNPETIIVLRGYTDRSGVRTYNLKLSEFRADTVKTYLVGRGVKAETITSIAVGPDAQGPGGTSVAYDGPRRKVLIEIVSPDA